MTGRKSSWLLPVLNTKQMEINHIMSPFFDFCMELLPGYEEPVFSVVFFYPEK